MQGFFVLNGDKYIGPFDKLNEARSEARLLGNNIPIFHGIFKEGIFTGMLVPKNIGQ